MAKHTDKFNFDKPVRATGDTNTHGDALMNTSVLGNSAQTRLGIVALLLMAAAGCSSDNESPRRSDPGLTETPPPNSAPNALNDSYTVAPGSVLTVDAVNGVLSNDRFTGETATVSLVGGVGSTGAVLDSDGSFTFRHQNTGGNRVESFTYTLTDEFGQTDQATVTITANEAPVAVSDAFTFPNDNFEIPVSNILLNDSDPDGDAVDFAGVFDEIGLDVDVEIRSGVTYLSIDPSSAPNGQFDYSITDIYGAEDTATVFFTFSGESNPDVFAKNDRFAVARGGSLTVSLPGVLLNDTIDGEPVMDLIQLNDQGTPECSDDIYSGGVRVVLVQGREPVQHDDRDATTTTGAGPFKLLNFGENGSCEALNFRYVHDGSDQKVDTFDYYLVQGSGSTIRQSAPATVSIEILEAATNDAPIARDEEARVNPGKTVDVPVLYNDSDREERYPCFVKITNPPACGSVDASLIQSCDQKRADPDVIPADNLGVVRYTHDPNDANKPNCRVQTDTELTDSFAYEVSDSNGATDQATVTVRIIPDANSAPSTQNDEFSVPANEFIEFDVLANDSDPDNDNLILELADGLDADTINACNSSGQTDPDDECNTQRATGTVTFDPDTGLITYTPVSTDILVPPYSDVFEYKINDGRAEIDTDGSVLRGKIGRASVTINVRDASVNQPPNACDDPVDLLDGDDPPSGCAGLEFANGREAFGAALGAHQEYLDNTIRGDKDKLNKPNDTLVQLFTVPACAERELALNILINDTDIDPEDRPQYRFDRVEPYLDRNPPRAVFQSPSDPVFGVGGLRVDENAGLTSTGSDQDSNNGRRSLVRVSDDRRYIYYQHVGGNLPFCESEDLNGDGVLDEDDSFVDTFTYVVEDGKGKSDQGLIQVRVVPNRSGNLTGVKVPGCGISECWGNDVDCDDDEVPDVEDQCPCTPPFIEGTPLVPSIAAAGRQTSTPIKTVFSNGCSIQQNEDRLDADGDGIAHYTYTGFFSGILVQNCASRSAIDNCTSVANSDQLPTEACGAAPRFCGSGSAIDSDGDGIADANDNCPNGRNDDNGTATNAGEQTAQDNQRADTDQTDTDSDGTGDICDRDNDGDDVPDNNDVCPYEPVGFLPDLVNPGCPTLF